MIGSTWTRELFDGCFYASLDSASPYPSISAVFVQSADGNTVIENPEELGGGATDEHLIFNGLSRVAVDAVLGGWNTVRGSNAAFSVWLPELVALRESLGKPRHPAQIVATKNGVIDLDSELIFNVPELRVFLLTIPAGAKRLETSLATRPWITVIEGKNPAEGLRRLKTDFGIRRISLIGGRKITTKLVDSGLVQDLYLTTSVMKGGQPDTPWYSGLRKLRKNLVVEKKGRGSEKGTIFQHFLLS